MNHLSIELSNLSLIKPKLNLENLFEDYKTNKNQSINIDSLVEDFAAYIELEFYIKNI